MTISIYNYALILALFRQGRDYLDSFYPFVLKVADSRRITNIDVQASLNDEFRAKIPIHVIESLVLRCIKQDYLNRDSSTRQITITSKGREYCRTLESESDVKNRAKALIDNIKEFYNLNEIIIETEEIKRVLSSFIEKNLSVVVDFLNPRSEKRQLRLKLTKREKMLLDYIVDSESSQSEHYHTLKDIILGSLISVVIRTKNTDEILQMTNKNFSSCKIYLDTNFIFSLFEFHQIEFNKAANELLELLKKNNFRLRIFDFTVDEIVRVMQGFINVGNRYPQSINVDSIYGILRRKGWTPRIAQEFIITIENRLEKEGFSIESTSIDLLNYEKPKEKIRKSISRYKPDQDVFHQNHDLAAIERIKRKRKKRIWKLERSKYIFLTSDAGLSQFNYINHRDHGTICEVIFDKLFTTILWLKNPDFNISLLSIITAYSRDLFINKHVWDQFYDVLSELKKDGKVDNESVASLFYHNYIEEPLKLIPKSEIAKITSNFVLDEIEKARDNLEDQRKREVKLIESKLKEQYDEQFQIQLERDIDEVKKGNHQKLIEQIDSSYKTILVNAQTDAGNRTKIIRGGLVVFFLVLYIPIGIPFILWLIEESQPDLFNLFAGLCSIIGIFIFSLFIPISFHDLIWKKVERFLFRHYKKKRLKESGFSKLMELLT